MTDHHIALAGASGGCYALIGAHLASVVVVSCYTRFKMYPCTSSLCMYILMVLWVQGMDYVGARGDFYAQIGAYLPSVVVVSCFTRFKMSPCTSSL